MAVPGTVEAGSENSAASATIVSIATAARTTPSFRVLVARSRARPDATTEARSDPAAVGEGWSGSEPRVRAGRDGGATADTERGPASLAASFDTLLGPRSATGVVRANRRSESASTACVGIRSRAS